MQHELFAEKSCGPRFSGSRISRDQEVASADREPERFAGARDAEHDLISSDSIGRQPHRICRLPDVRRKSAGTVSAHDLLRSPLECRTSPADGYTDLARREEIVVVFGIADGDRVVSRQT
jgi:hypothetical protein